MTNVAGEKNGRRFFPVVATIFFFVLASNWLSLLPVFNVIGGESVLLSLKSERYFGLDAVGTKMWTVLTTAPSIEAAQQTLIQEYDVDPQRL